jgi:WD40 repeat protein
VYKKSIILLIVLTINIMIIGMKRLNPYQLQQNSLSIPHEITQEIAAFVKTKQWWYLHKTITHKNCIKSVYYDHSGKLFEVGSNNNNVFISDVKSGKEVVSIAHRKKILAIYPDPFGKKIATGSEDGKIRIFDIQSRTKTDSFTALNIYANALCFDPSGTKIATGGAYIYRTIEEIFTTKTDHETVSIFDIQSHKKITSFPHDFYIDSICFNPSGTLLAIGSRDGKAHIFDIGLGKETTFFENSYHHCVDSSCFDFSGKLFATGSNNTTNIFDIQSHKKIASFTGNDDIKSVYFSPSGELIITTICNNSFLFIHHENFTLDQLLLKNALITWLLIEKPNKKIETLEQLIGDVALKCAISSEEFKKTWSTFPENMQYALWRTMEYRIQKYGKNK